MKRLAGPPRLLAAVLGALGAGVVFWIAMAIYLAISLAFDPAVPDSAGNVAVMVLGLFSLTIMAAVFAVVMVPIAVGARAVAELFAGRTRLAVQTLAIVIAGAPVGVVLNVLSESDPASVAWPMVIVATLGVALLLAGGIERKGVRV